MKKVIVFILLSVLVFPLPAQIQRGLKGSYDVDSFPKVSFVWNSPNPDVLKQSQFALFEGDSAVDFKLDALPVKTNEINKSILILWEDMASHSRQSDFTTELLTRFFRETDFSEEDMFEVAVFNRKRDEDTHLLKLLVGQFTADENLLANTVASYKKNSRQFGSFPQQSDLYLAINEGISLLSREPASREGVIIVVTAGLNLKASGASTEMETVRKNALDAGIPVYVVKYPLTGNTPEVNVLAESTYGRVVSSTTTPSDALTNLKRQYEDLDRRLQGQDYKFSFTTNVARDGKPHPLRLTVDKVNQPLRVPFVAPKQTFGQWIVCHWWVALLVVLALSGGIVWIVLLSKKKKQERENAKLALEEQMKESERRNQEAVEKMRKEQAEKERVAQEAAVNAQIAAEEERLGRLMQTKNLFPRLQCRVGNESFTYSIVKPCITLGRDETNDVAFTMRNSSFNNQTVSGFHAEIVFNGSAFDVVNKSHTYTQGVIVNGQFFQRYTLRSGDMIGLGEAIITFYI